ncbi:MAG: type VI secretion system baseplate subunit TssG [Chitinispirillaceae bacterium]
MALGKDAILGESVYDRSGKFRVVPGFLNLDTYMSFLPGRPAR